jgi:NAD-dependent dihydropyrimidine dehydrogenase PreA subunit
MPLTVVLSTGQSRSPEKRALEESIVEAAKGWSDVRVIVIPHLYDLVADGPSITQLRQVHGPLAVVSWMYERATHWILNRMGIQGQLVPTELSEQDEDEEAYTDTSSASDETPNPNLRTIHCLDLRVRTIADAFISELRRLADLHLHSNDQSDSAVSPNVQIGPQQELTLANVLLGTFLDSSSPALANDAHADSMVSAVGLGNQNFHKVDEHPTRRWYPVIDFSRCTNCMECIDFCLFGVYGVDAAERILVEQPDNCRKGCPACSRVCPANAIIFPQHKTPAIAGAIGGDSSFKIDLSKLFGAPESDEDAKDTAARERDEQLILAGRPAVGAKDSNDIPTRTSAVIRAQWSASKPQNGHLDSLLDQLDQSDL